jgi:hypothetical protein
VPGSGARSMRATNRWVRTLPITSIHPPKHQCRRDFAAAELAAGDQARELGFAAPGGAELPRIDARFLDGVMPAEFGERAIRLWSYRSGGAHGTPQKHDFGGMGSAHEVSVRRYREASRSHAAHTHGLPSRCFPGCAIACYCPRMRLILLDLGDVDIVGVTGSIPVAPTIISKA